MREGTKRDLRTVVVAVFAAAATGTAIPAIGAVFDAGNTKRVAGKVAQTSLGPGRSVVGSACDPTSNSYVSCGSVRLTLPAGGRVLLTLDGVWETTTAP